MRKRILPSVLLIFLLAISGSVSAQTFYGYDVVSLKLKSPVTVQEGDASRTFNEVFIVRLRGEFPPQSKAAFEFFIGPYQVLDWGRMKDGVFFKIYGEDRLRSLSGKPFLYRSNNSEIVNCGLTFVPEDFTPFKSIDETEAFEPLERKTNYLGVFALLLGVVPPGFVVR
jgi:hypothetical protein